ncbi:rhomboid family intramembrane serine protease [Candidatus Dojkabacteria bacterium]|nr:rhomboid family intramembrane serine protease [Candidatus Dojkabacteria bacterium]
MRNTISRISQELKYGTYATYSLIGLNIIIFLLVNIVKSFFQGASEVEIASVFGGTSTFQVIGSFQWWRLITAIFLQLDWWHILFNMIALYSTGRFLENFYSSKKVLVVYVLTGVSGSLLSLLDTNAITFGASGAVFGLIGLIVGNLLRKNTYSPGLPIKMSSLYPSLVWLVLSFGIGGISFLGHLGGFLSGILIGLILETANDFGSNTFQNRLTNVSFIMCVALVTLSFISLFLSIFFNF